MSTIYTQTYKSVSKESTYTQSLMKNVGVTKDFLSNTELVVLYAYHSA